MNTAKTVSNLILQWKSEGLSKRDIVVKAANACMGWPYIYGDMGTECTSSHRLSVYKAHTSYTNLIDKCQMLKNKADDCSGCRWYPGGRVLGFDCRGFTYWLLKQVGITIKGAGATTQYDTDSNWEEKGPIANMPRDKVCCVFRYDNGTGRMEHTLLYDGEGNYIHCSGEVKKCATSKYDATHYAIPKGLNGGVEPVPGDENATVYSENGLPVKMREEPTTKCNRFVKVPCGARVTVLEPGTDWSHIKYEGKGGYMMSEFLKMDTPGEQKYRVSIPGQTKEEAEELQAKYPQAVVTPE